MRLETLSTDPSPLTPTYEGMADSRREDRSSGEGSGIIATARGHKTLFIVKLIQFSELIPSSVATVAFQQQAQSSAGASKAVQKSAARDYQFLHAAALRN